MVPIKRLAKAAKEEGNKREWRREKKNSKKGERKSREKKEKVE